MYLPIKIRLTKTNYKAYNWIFVLTLYCPVRFSTRILKYVECLFCDWKNFEKTSHCRTFQCCKWPNIKKSINQSGHTVCNTWITDIEAFFCLSARYSIRYLPTLVLSVWPYYLIYNLWYLTIFFVSNVFNELALNLQHF